MSDQELKYTTIHYHSYLHLDKILGAQIPRSGDVEEKPAHEEMLFIIIHQVYELWFKQIKHELESVLDMFLQDNVHERSIGTACSRLERIEEIMKLLIQQIRVLETMTPLDFLDFRNYLFPASGFQSFQFRMVEVMLGLEEKKRLTYNNHHYASVFQEEQQQSLKKATEDGSLFDVVEAWLERTPFLKWGDFKFLNHYRKAVESMIAKEQSAIKGTHYLTEKEKEMRLKMLGSTDTYFQSVLNKEVHQQMKEEGKLRLSYRATVAALFINLYRDEPILHGPFRLLTNLIDIDELLTTWRYRHAQMVLRMLGRKIGTGGSSGHDYLHATAVKHHIFTDLHNISTLLIPRSELPPLPDELKRELGFYYTQK
ncbi:MAG: tryptophan 2,3-dioxygenase family protein [Bacteroidota bacterium]